MSGHSIQYTRKARKGAPEKGPLRAVNHKGRLRVPAVTRPWDRFAGWSIRAGVRARRRTAAGIRRNYVDLVGGVSQE